MLRLLLTLTLVLTACTDVQFSKDSVNNQACEGCSSSLPPVIRDVHETFTTPASNKVDIVFVVDNSQSMAYEQTQLSTRLNAFTSVISNLDWRIAITSTDVSSGPGIQQGRLKPFNISGQPLFITKDTPNYASLFESHVVLGDNGSSNEQGINATTYVIEKNANGNQNWMRPDAQFAAVVLSDEDECSYQKGTCMGPRNQAQALVDKMVELYGSQKNFSFHSLVVQNQQCETQQELDGYQAYIGNMYKSLTNLTGGIQGDICALSRSYTEQLTEMGNLIQNYTDSVSLQCAPVDGIVDVRRVGGEPILHQVRGNRVIFLEVVNPGTAMTLDYKCEE